MVIMVAVDTSEAVASVQVVLAGALACVADIPVVDSDLDPLSAAPFLAVDLVAHPRR